MKVKTGDQILVIGGKDRGKTGAIMRVLPKYGRVIVEKVNVKIRNVKKTATRAGQRIQFEAPFDASNVMLLCPSCSKPTRIGYETPESGKKYRICKICKKSLDQKK